MHRGSLSIDRGINAIYRFIRFLLLYCNFLPTGSREEPFINEFLLREDVQPIETGIDNLDPFFYFYIHKCMWSTPASVRSMAAGLKKFYKCMAEHEIIEEEDYVEICEEIKESLPSWVEDCEEFNDW